MGRSTARNALFVITLTVGGCLEAQLDDLDELDDSGLPEECDGAEQLGETCSTGEGMCERTGMYACADGELVCKADPPAMQELCDTQQDEDCDDEVDEAPDGKCCSDADCGTGLCSFPQVTDADTGMPVPVTSQGGSCIGGTSQACEDDQDCPSADFDCEDGRCVLGPLERGRGFGQSSGGGLAAGGGYALQVQIASPGPMGTMSGGGYVLRAGLHAQ